TQFFASSSVIAIFAAPRCAMLLPALKALRYRHTNKDVAMAVDDIQDLHEQCEALFEQRPLPPQWNDYRHIPIPWPGKPAPQDIAQDRALESWEEFSAVNPLENHLDMATVAPLRTSFPGALSEYRRP